MKTIVRRLLKISICLIISAVFSCILFFYYEQASRYNFRVAAESYLSPDAAQYSREIKSIVDYLNSQVFKTESEKFDFIRNWIYKNSIHDVDSTYNLKDAFNVQKSLSMMWKTHKTETDRIRLTCGPRAMAMKYILDKLEKKSRIVMIFSDASDQVESHTFLEVFNVEAKQFEIHDPDYNIYYVDHNSNRIDIFELIFNDHEKIYPVSDDKKGWGNNNMIHIKDMYLKAFMYGNPVTTKRPIVVINKAKFNLNKKFSRNGNISFYEFTKKYYRDPLVLILKNKNISFMVNPLIKFMVNISDL